MSTGMYQGLFTGRKLADYVTASATDYPHARRIINGMDRAQLIASYAEDFEKVLNASRTA